MGAGEKIPAFYAKEEAKVKITSHQMSTSTTSMLHNGPLPPPMQHGHGRPGSRPKLYLANRDHIRSGARQPPDVAPWILDP